LIERTSLKQINSLLEKNKNWKVLDIGCGYTAHEKANYVADVQDFSKFYQNKNKFIKIENKILPFKDKEFDFVIASHVIEHVEDFSFFINELERISNQGYIELPTRLGDNLIFENTTDHIWWFVFDDNEKKLLATKRKQTLEPFLSVATGRKLTESFRESLVIELIWKDKINFCLDNSINNNTQKKISFLTIIKKYFSKRLRMFFS
jgi:SAM-dependent methyltransferase|tara:strand:- start:2348 stop:2965 length:618 start_codon:yes stop_codon:yes gene_type:complete